MKRFAKPQQASELGLRLSRALVKGQDLLKVALLAPRRAPLTPDLALVLDRSGSMAGRKLQEAKAAALAVLEAFPERGRVAVVAYDHEVEVGGLDRKAARAYLEALEARGSTALHAGWRQGALLLKDPTRPRFLFLLSDGLANVGLTDPEALAEEARKAAREGVYTFTLGFGEGYHRGLMARMAREGGGVHRYVAEGELLAALLAELAFLKAPVNLGVRVRLGGTEVHLAPFAPEEERVLLLPVEAPVLEVEEGLPGGAVLHRLPLPEPAPEGSEAWREVELEALLWEAGRLLEREAASEEEAKALAEEAEALSASLRAHPLGESERALALVQALEAFKGAMERLAASYDALASDRVAREGAAFLTQLSFPLRLSRMRYRDRTGEPRGATAGGKQVRKKR
ncbi:MAG: vWA domain-containing protein [Thermus sp.]|uniref:vWA domain-containing protein n=1 Tax=Thermus sp. TaxID=275 RepID=UPI003D112490